MKIVIAEDSQFEPEIPRDRTCAFEAYLIKKIKPYLTIESNSSCV